MAKLENIDKNKIVSFRYASIGNTSSTPQTFEDGHSGYVVTGTRDLIHEKYLDSGRSKEEATTLDPGADTPIMEESLTQIYNVTNPAGSYTITGLKGDFGFSESDLMMENSLILSTWKNKVDAHTLRAYAAPLIKNHTTGVREMPIVIRDFGSGSVEAKGIRFGSGKPGFTVELQRGGNAVGDIVDNYTDIVTKNSFWSRFVDKQSDLQDYAIMRGGGTFGEAPFDTFDGLTFQLGFEPGVRTYRNAGMIAGVARYTENVPFHENVYYTGGKTLKYNVREPLKGQLDSMSAEDIDYETDNKMMFLYNSFILGSTSDGKEIGMLDQALRDMSSMYRSYVDMSTQSSWLTNLFPSSVEDPTDPYPIVPVKNVVNSIKLEPANMMYGYPLETALDVELQKDQVDSVTFMKYTGVSAHKDIKWGNNLLFTGKVNEDGLRTVRYAAGHATGSIMQRMIGADIEKKIDGAVGDVPPYVPTINKRYADSMKAGLEVSETDGALLAKKYTSLGYEKIPMKHADMATDDNAKYRYGETLTSPLEWNLIEKADYKHDDLAKIDSAKKKAESGIRVDGQTKVYAIGKQGFRGVDSLHEVITDDKTILGRIKKQGDNKYKTDFSDKVNLIPYNSTLSGKATTGEDPVDLDFVPLVFYDVYNKRDIVFRSILGDITDTITPNWSEENFIGRPTGVANYKGVGRSIGFNFEVYPKTKQEFPVLLEKVNYLVGLCYPHLDKHYRQTGPMIRLTLGDIVQKQLGYISACTVTFPEASPWETDPGLRFTKQISIDLTFEYIGGYIPVATGKHYGLDWLDGTKYDINGVAFEKFPNRNNNNTDMKPLFSELGQE